MERIQPQIWTVSQLSQYVKGALACDPLLQNLGIKGEVANFKHHSSGHMYFTLKDSKSGLSCVMFRNRNRTLEFTPEDGMLVVAFGSIGVFTARGLYQLYVEEMEPAGVGSLHLAFEEIKARLEKEGLFAPERKRPLPLIPRKVGVITAATGAAIRDIITVTRRRFPNVDLIVAPVLVQGDRAPGEMKSALEALAGLPGVEVIILARGGGAWEELWAFNDEDLARAVAECPVPVISGVGHETDFTIVDFAADVRAPTPSAAGELAVPAGDELKGRINNLRDRCFLGLDKVFRQREKILENLVKRRPFSLPSSLLVEKIQVLDGLSRRLERAMEQALLNWNHRLALHRGRLDSLSPLSILDRGYSVVFAPSGFILKDAVEVSRGARVRIKLAKGQLECIVEQVEVDGDERTDL